MILLGITGPIGHGKTTLANFLTQLEPTAQQAESSQIIAEVANKLNVFFDSEQPNESDIASVNRWLAHLPQILQGITQTIVPEDKVHLTKNDVTRHPADYEKLWEYIAAARTNPSLAHQPITSDNKQQYRTLLQWLGGYFVTHVDSGIWYNELIRRSQSAAKQGCALFVIGGVRFPSDGQIVQAAGGAVIQITRPGSQELDVMDPTERERSKIRHDTLVINDGSLTQLKKVAGQLYSDLRHSTVQKRYQAQATSAS